MMTKSMWLSSCTRSSGKDDIQSELMLCVGLHEGEKTRLIFDDVVLSWLWNSISSLQYTTRNCLDLNKQSMFTSQVYSLMTLSRRDIWTPDMVKSEYKSLITVYRLTLSLGHGDMYTYLKPYRFKLNIGELNENQFQCGREWNFQWVIY